MSVHDGALGALDSSLRDDAAPTFLITRGEDGALQWQPPARSLELANALSYHYPLEDTIEKKMQCAILDFLKSDIPERLNKLTQDVSQGQESPLQPVQNAHGSEMFAAWDVKTGKSVNIKGRKRGLSPMTRQRVAKNRGKTCAHHRKAKTICHPNECPQNKLYPGITGNSIPKGTVQKLPNQKDKWTDDNSQTPTDGSVIKSRHNSHLGKHSNALPSPSLSPPELNLPAEVDQTTSCAPDHNCGGSKQDFHDFFPSGAEPGHADGERPLLIGVQNQPRELGNLVENSPWALNSNAAGPLVNEIDWSQWHDIAEQFPSGYQLDFEQVVPPDSGNGDIGHAGRMGDFMEFDLPSLERDWPREDDDVLFRLSPSSPYPSISLDYGQVLGFQHAINHGGSKDTLSIDLPKASPEALAAPSTQFYRGNLRLDIFAGLDASVSQEERFELPSKPLAQPAELDDDGPRIKASEASELGKDVIRKYSAPTRRALAVEVKAPVPRGGQLISSKEEPSIEELSTLLQKSTLKFLGTLQQIYPGKDDSSSADIVLLDRNKRIPFAETDLESIRKTLGLGLSKLRLLHSSSISIYGDILPSSETSPQEEVGILPSDGLESPTEEQHVWDSYFVLNMDLLSQITPASDGRLLTLLYRSEAASTFFKRAIITPSDPVAQSPPSNAYSLCWLDTEWRTVESILSDLGHTTNKYPRLHSSSRKLSTDSLLMRLRFRSDSKDPPLSNVSKQRTSVNSFAERGSVSDGVEVASVHEEDLPELDQPFIMAHLGGQHMGPLMSPPLSSTYPRRTATASSSRHAQRTVRRKSSAAVTIINKPVDAVKDLWTKLARVKL